VNDIVRRARSAVAPGAHAVLNRVHPTRGRRAFQQEFEQARRSGGLVKVIIGAGRKPLPGWINTDVVWQVPAYLDATRPWPVPAGSVDLIYGDDVIEHVTLEQARLLFRHAFTALKPGGILRLATPDVEAVARQYLENGELARAGLERNRELGRTMRYPVELLREVYVGAQHYLGFIYDWESLSTEMSEAGFRTRRAAYGQSEHPDLVGLEVRMHPAEQATGLVVEGVKP
jgi:predicted SAM-dependent methyltransferase